MRERVCEFGPQLNLTGLLTEPTATTHPELPAVVMLNAGLLHRVGPHRMSVILARKLAEQGKSPEGATLAEMEALWEESKR